MNSIPLFDIRSSYLTQREAIDRAIAQVVSTHQFVGGAAIDGLESRLAEYVGTRHAVALSSGTDALILALEALGVGPGDEVITTPFTFVATVNSVLRVGARPVLVDIDPVSMTIDPSAVEAAISERSRAVLPVHLFGRCADMAALSAIAEAHSLFMIEDAAQALGAERDGRSAGAWGHCGCFSLFPSKNLGAFGDAGFLTSDSDQLVDRVRRLRNHGAIMHGERVVVGGNFRMDEIQAAVVLVKLEQLDLETRQRQRVAATYGRLFNRSGLVERGLVQPPAEGPDKHVFHLYVCRFQRRERVMAALTRLGIECRAYYSEPLHHAAEYGFLGYERSALPQVCRAAAEILALPMFPGLGDEQIEHIVAAIGAAYDELGGE